MVVMAVTNRHLVEGSFEDQLRRIAQGGPGSILLREKDLDQQAYYQLALRCKKICDQYHVPLFGHFYPDACRRAGLSRVHLPMTVLRRQQGKLEGFLSVGASVHSVEEALEAEGLGADYLIAGHIFETGCKPGVAPRGLDFLEQVCGAVSIPVYAIGGITPVNAGELRKRGAFGACIMSAVMQSKDMASLLLSYHGI